MTQNTDQRKTNFSPAALSATSAHPQGPTLKALPTPEPPPSLSSLQAVILLDNILFPTNQILLCFTVEE